MSKTASFQQFMWHKDTFHLSYATRHCPPVKVFCRVVGVTLATIVMAKITPTEFETPLTVGDDVGHGNDVSPEHGNNKIPRSNLIKSPLPPLFQRGELNNHKKHRRMMVFLYNQTLYR